MLKSRLAKVAGAEPSSQMRDKHFWQLRCSWQAQWIQHLAKSEQNMRLAVVEQVSDKLLFR